MTKDSLDNRIKSATKMYTGQYNSSFDNPVNQYAYPSYTYKMIQPSQKARRAMTSNRKRTLNNLHSYHKNKEFRINKSPDNETKIRRLKVPLKDFIGQTKNENQMNFKTRGYNKSIDRKFRQDWKVTYTNNQYYRKSTSKLRQRDSTPEKSEFNLKHMLVNLARKKKKRQLPLNLVTKTEEHHDHHMKIEDYEYLTEKYSEIITPMKLYVQLPNLIPSRYLQSINHLTVDAIYSKILNFLSKNKYDEVIAEIDVQINGLQVLKQEINIETDKIALYKINLINNYISMFIGLKASTYVKIFKNKNSLELFKQCISLAQENLSNFSDSKLMNACKTNLVIYTYNYCMLLYMKQELKE